MGDGIPPLQALHRFTSWPGSIAGHRRREVPEGQGDNWIPTKPGTGFFSYFRWYGPLGPYFDKTWRLPDIEPT
jgi:hypothetical protein